MSKSNRNVRIALARIFGSGCMFRKSHAEEFIEKLGTIKTYKKFKQEKHYTSKQIKQLEQLRTFHHLKHKSESGSTSIDNGAIINELAHRYMHSLPRNQEEIINDYIREWKKKNYKECEIEIVDFPLPDFEIKCFEFDTEGLRKDFNRAKIKRETKKALENYYKELGD